MGKGSAARASLSRAEAEAEQRLVTLRSHVRESAADRPGVYRMIAEDGEVVYVGKSKRLRSRLLSYFRAAFPEEKGARIVREASSIEWTYVPSEFAALLEELRQIKRLRPRLNLAMKRDARNHAFVAITRGPAPRLAVLRGTGSRGESVVYGPFNGAVRLKEALRELSDALGLRDCTHDRRMRFADQQEIFTIPPRTPGCIRFEIGKCLGPCIAAPDEDTYHERVAQARAFLDGADDGPLQLMEVAMREASRRLEFERAGALRDKRQRLEDLRGQFDRMRFAVENLTFTYHVPGVGDDDRVYLIRRGVVREELPAPRCEEDRILVTKAARRVLSDHPGHGPRSIPRHEVDELLVVASWFRAHPDELAQTRPIEAA
jgi:excinuclease ABC subunit C